MRASRVMLAVAGALEARGFTVGVDGDGGDGVVSSREAVLRLGPARAADGEALRRTMTVTVRVPVRNGIDGLAEMMDAVDEAVEAVVSIGRATFGDGKVSLDGLEYVRSANWQGARLDVTMLV